MRELRTLGRAFDAEVEVYENCKYTAHSIKDLGQTRKVKYDDITNMTSDMVRILGRQPSAIAVVGDKYFAKVAA